MSLPADGAVRAASRASSREDGVRARAAGGAACRIDRGKGRAAGGARRRRRRGERPSRCSPRRAAAPPLAGRRRRRICQPQAEDRGRALRARSRPQATIGIDVEDLRPLRVDVASRVLPPEERARCSRPNRPARDAAVLLAFSAKEAIYRQRSIPGCIASSRFKRPPWPAAPTARSPRASRSNGARGRSPSSFTTRAPGGRSRAPFWSRLVYERAMPPKLAACKESDGRILKTPGRARR